MYGEGNGYHGGNRFWVGVCAREEFIRIRCSHRGLRNDSCGLDRWLLSAEGHLNPCRFGAMLGRITLLPVPMG